MRHLVSLLFVIGSGFLLGGCEGSAGQPDLTYSFDKGYGQVEVGGRYVGMEFHQSRPLPSRISFYYPVANSVDLSTGYWQRADSRPMAVGIRIGSGERHWVGRDAWSYTLSPHTVTFHRESDGLLYAIRYEFCFNDPAAVMTLTIRNGADHILPIELYTHLRLLLRTCQTYARQDLPVTERDTASGAIAAHFDTAESDSATLFVLNAGLKHSTSTTSASDVAATDSGTSNWIEGDFPPPPEGDGRYPAAAAFTYEKRLNPGDSLVVVQVIGSCRRNEWKRITRELLQSRLDEVAAYDRFIRSKAYGGPALTTGDSVFDKSAVWARALIAANQHYINGHIVPMPCPAEYNFFFTHDLLVTNLGAVNIDIARVKRDLLYVASLSKGNVIPHAYYWKDDGFKTELCGPDNWNHLWFILLTGSYLRHSMDDSTGHILYPLVSKSIEELLSQKKQDNLMHGFRPDWWDIGHIEGQRAYLTILAIRALRESLFISAALGKSSPDLNEREHLADAMQTALTNQLWDSQLKYLMDRNGGVPDRHYYMGPLLAPVFGVLDGGKAGELVATAGRKLLDDRIGVRTAMPPDFHTIKSTQYYKFAGDEAGQPYYYLNGGVWPHNNAWYALALRSVGKVDEAFRFVRSVMTLDGVMKSPMGVPAMYEYRFSDPESPAFGGIDKPSFLWAGGFYLYTLYNLFGIKDNEWNISIGGPLPAGIDSVRLPFTMGSVMDLVSRGDGETMTSVTVDGVSIPSLVVPTSCRDHSRLRVMFGDRPESPYVKGINAMLHSAEWDEGKQILTMTISSFAGHRVTLDLTSPSLPRGASLDGVSVSDPGVSESLAGVHSVQISFVAGSGQQQLQIRF